MPESSEWTLEERSAEGRVWEGRAIGSSVVTPHAQTVLPLEDDANSDATVGVFDDGRTEDVLLTVKLRAQRSEGSTFVTLDAASARELGQELLDLSAALDD
jgi:hypothetical protein